MLTNRDSLKLKSSTKELPQIRNAAPQFNPNSRNLLQAYLGMLGEDTELQGEVNQIEDSVFDALIKGELVVRNLTMQQKKRRRERLQEFGDHSPVLKVHQQAVHLFE